MGRHHEPCGADELYLGNTLRDKNNLEFLKQKGMRTIRLGDVAYDLDGKVLSASYAPLFIKRSEEQLYDAIMMEKTFGPNWRRG